MWDHFRQFTLVICVQVEKAPLPTRISVGVLIEEDTGEFKKRGGFTYIRVEDKNANGNQAFSIS